MVQLPILHRAMTTEMMAPVNELINEITDSSKPRKRMANAGFVRSDRFVAEYGYSMSTIHKYRGVHYGDEMFLPPSPTTKGRIRIHQDVAKRLDEAGIRSRGSKPAKSRLAKRKPSPTPNADATPVDFIGGVVEANEKRSVIDEVASNPVMLQRVISRAAEKVGLDGVYIYLVAHEKLMETKEAAA